MKLSPEESSRLEAIRRRVDSPHVPTEALAMQPDVPGLALVVGPTPQGEEVAVNAAGVPFAEVGAFAAFVAHAGPDVRFLLALVERAMGQVPPAEAPSEAARALEAQLRAALEELAAAKAAQQRAWEAGAEAMRQVALEAARADTDGLLTNSALAQLEAPVWPGATAPSEGPADTSAQLLCCALHASTMSG